MQKTHWLAILALIGSFLTRAEAADLKIDFEVGERWEYHISDTAWMHEGTKSMNMQITLQRIDSTAGTEFDFLVKVSGKNIVLKYLPEDFYYDTTNIDTTFSINCKVLASIDCTEPRLGYSYFFEIYLEKLFAKTIYGEIINSDPNYPEKGVLVNDSTTKGFYWEYGYSSPYGPFIDKIYALKEIGVVSRYIYQYSRGVAPGRFRAELINHNGIPFSTGMTIAKIDSLRAKTNSIVDRIKPKHEHGKIKGTRKHTPEFFNGRTEETTNAIGRILKK